jgi:hypothetical protein
MNKYAKLIKISAFINEFTKLTGKKTISAIYLPGSILIGEVLGKKIYAVDGSFIRDWCLDDFIGGGNSKAYPQLDENEFWVENLCDGLEPGSEKYVEKKNDMNCLLVHEVIEWTLMNYAHMKYPEAHKFANRIETMVRKNRISKTINEGFMETKIERIKQAAYINELQKIAGINLPIKKAHHIYTGTIEEILKQNKHNDRLKVLRPGHGFVDSESIKQAAYIDELKKIAGFPGFKSPVTLYSKSMKEIFNENNKSVLQKKEMSDNVVQKREWPITEQIKQSAYIDELQKIAKLTDYEKEQNRRVKRQVSRNSLWPTVGAMGLVSVAPAFLQNVVGIHENPFPKYDSQGISHEDDLINKIRIDQDKDKSISNKKGLNKGFKNYIDALEKTPVGQNVEIKSSIFDKINQSKYVSGPKAFAKYQLSDIVHRPFSYKHKALAVGAGLVAGKVYRDVMMKKYKKEKEKQPLSNKL